MSKTAERFPFGRALTAVTLAALLADRFRSRAAFASRELRVCAMAEEHAALHAVAALVARGADLEALCARVAESAAALLGGEVALLLRFDEQKRAKLVGRWVRSIRDYPELGEELEFAPNSAIGSVLRTGRTSRVSAGTPSLFERQFSERVATPIELDGRVWGALAVGGAAGEGLPADAETRIERFSELVSLAIANSEARAQLVAQATTDPLTGLANHRNFHERLLDEVSRSHRYGRPLSLIVFDVDRFKSVNDSTGHLAGDAVLAGVARRIVTAMRADSLVSRLGGDEFAALLPECDAAGARMVAERARALVCAQPIGSYERVTVSAGVSELEAAWTAEEFLDRADSALYRAKGRGRDACLVYSPLSAA